MNLSEKVQHYKDGLATLISWLGSGGICAPQEKAQARTNTCLKCEFNQPGSVLTESVAKAIKTQMQLKNTLGKRTNGIRGLKTCQKCTCYLPLKIFIPLDKLGLDDEDKRKFPNWCWANTEQP